MPGKKPRMRKAAAGSRRAATSAGQPRPTGADHRLSLIAEVTEAIVGSKSLAKRAAEMAERVRAAFGVDACVIRLLDKDQLILLAKAGVPNGTLFKRIPTSWGVTERVLSDDEPVFIPDVRASVETAPVAGHLRRPLPFLAYAGTSLTAGGRVLGILGIYWGQARPKFTEPDLRCLQSVGHSVGAAIANQRLYEEVRAQKNEFRAEIKSRKRAEAALRESEGLLRSFAANLPGVAFITDKAGMFRLAEGRGLAALGLKPEALVGHSVFDLYAEVPQIMENIRRSLAGEEFQSTVELQGMVFEVFYLPLWESSARIGGVLGIASNVTRRKQAELALRESEERFRLAMEATTDGLWDWDTCTDQAYFSPGYYRLLGYEPNEFQMSGAGWLDRLHPDDREKALKANRDCIENLTQEFEVEFRMQSKSGEWKWICGRGKAARRDARGQATRLVGTHVDITGRKQAEEALRRSHRDYVRLSRDRQKLLEQERTRISRHLHDELGQSLTFLVCQLARFEKRVQAVDPQLAAELGEARAQTREMIASIRMVARSLRPIAIEHDGLIPSLRSSVAEFQRVSGISSRLVVELGEQVVDEPLATAVYRIVQECFTNMARHANASGCEIRLLAKESHLDLTIRDNGHGAPPGALGGHRSLGIIGMKERAVAAGGKLSVQNHPRGGVIVRARFPLEPASHQSP